MTLKKKKTGRHEAPSGNGDTNVEACNEAGEDAKCLSIAECAYYKAESRGFEPGYELDDWLAAEGEISRSQSKPL